MVFAALTDLMNDLRVLMAKGSYSKERKEADVVKMTVSRARSVDSNFDCDRSCCLICCV